VTTPEEATNGDESPAATVTEHLPPLSGVVVGDDCSRNAHRAVAVAAEEAKRRNSPLHVVRSWSLTTAPRPATWEMGYMPSLAEWEQAVRDALEKEWGHLREEIPDLQLHPVHRSPKEVLVEASEHADVVVVGARGRGRMAGLVLGSVSDEVVRKTRCPVIVVPFVEELEQE
jgi:nucleotide-binding universal stress UspA family protein